MRIDPRQGHGHETEEEDMEGRERTRLPRTTENKHKMLLVISVTVPRALFVTQTSPFCPAFVMTDPQSAPLCYDYDWRDWGTTAAACVYHVPSNPFGYQLPPLTPSLLVD